MRVTMVDVHQVDTVNIKPKSIAGHIAMDQFEIKGSQFPLSDIFCSKFNFEIPEYQRPYAWAEEETSDLFNDLYDFFILPDRGSESYFLGSIVLIKKDNDAQAQVVDGQQRLVTLTILLALLTSKLQDPQTAEECKTYILEPGKKIEDIQPQPRLKLRERDQAFFFQYVQSFRFDELDKLESFSGQIQSTTSEPQPLNDSQKNIKNNAKKLSDLLDEKLTTQDELFAFVQFICKRCCMIVVSTPSEKSAFRIFAILNDRGMELAECDILKAHLIGKIEEAQRQTYTEKWEDIEETLGRKEFQKLFQKIRTQRDPSEDGDILDYYQKIYFGKNPDSEKCIEFIEKVLTANHEAILEIDKCKCSVEEYTNEVNGYLRWLNQTDNTDWQSPAIAMLIKFKNKDKDCSSREVRDFFKMLERLASYLYVTFADSKKRQSRYRPILKGINNGTWRKEIDLTPEEKTTLLSILDGNIDKHFYVSKYKTRQMYLLLRIDAFLPKDESVRGEHTDGFVRLEYVLPQELRHNPREYYWTMKWSDTEHSQWLSRIANIVLLPISRRNYWCYNKRFSDKKKDYFFKSGLTPYRLTNSVDRETEWTPTVVEERQRRLLRLIIIGWNLQGGSIPEWLNVPMS